MCSYCDQDDGHTIDTCPKRLDEKFADSSEFNPDGTRKAQLREGETRDDDSHPRVVAQQLDEADDETLEEIGEGKSQ